MSPLQNITSRISSGLGIIVIGAALTSCGKRAEPVLTDVSPKVISADTMIVSQAASYDFYLASGTISRRFSSILSSKVMGRVNSVQVREGDAVRKGQLLLSIDSRELAAAASVAQAGLSSSISSARSANTGVEIEQKTAEARVAQAESQITQAEAVLAAAKSKRDLILAGPRNQEISQARIAVVQAASSLNLATIELERTRKLVQDGALAKRELDIAQNQYDLAKGQYDLARESESIAKEGSRSQEIRQAQDGVHQSEAAVRQARSGLSQAKAAMLQVKLRRGDAEVAKAQVRQSQASVNAARVGLSYAQVFAPFAGKITKRMLDPGAMASPGVPLLQIEGGDILFSTSLPEKVLQFVELGQSVSVTLVDSRQTEVNAIVDEISPQGSASTHKFDLKLKLLDSPGLRSGQYGEAKFEIGSKIGIRISKDAVWERDGLRYVWVVDNDGLARLRIITGSGSGKNDFQVLSGLNIGERIVSKDPSSVSEGNRIGGL